MVVSGVIREGSLRSRERMFVVGEDIEMWTECIG